MKIVESKPLHISEVKEYLEKRKEEGELAYEQDQALTHATLFAKKSAKEDKALTKKVIDVAKVPLETAVKLVEISPTKVDTIKLVLAKDRLDVSEETISELLKLFK